MSAYGESGISVGGGVCGVVIWMWYPFLPSIYHPSTSHHIILAYRTFYEKVKRTKVSTMHTLESVIHQPHETLTTSHNTPQQSIVLWSVLESFIENDPPSHRNQPLLPLYNTSYRPCNGVDDRCSTRRNRISSAAYIEHGDCFFARDMHRRDDSYGIPLGTRVVHHQSGPFRWCIQ